MPSYWPSWWSRVWAVCMSRTAITAPPSESTSPNFAMPVIVYCETGPFADMPILSPTAYFFFLAVPASIATWSAPFGHSPVSSFSGLSSACVVSIADTIVGFWPPSALPSRPITFAVVSS